MLLCLSIKHLLFYENKLTKYFMVESQKENFKEWKNNHLKSACQGFNEMKIIYGISLKLASLDKFAPKVCFF